MQSTATRSRAVRDGVGVGVAVGLSGVAFGAASITAGLSVAETCALSLTAFTGASQFALIGVVGAGGNLLVGTAGALLLGGRNTLYGLRLSRLLQVRGPRRLAAAHAVIDETTAVALAQPDPAAARAGFLATSVSLFGVWNLMTLAGALAANRIGDPKAFGLDAAVPAAFLALLWPRVSNGDPRRRWIAVAGAAAAIAATPVLPPGVPVLLAALTALAGVRR